MRNLHAKAAGFPIAAANRAQNWPVGHGDTLYQDAVQFDGVHFSYDLPSDTELGPVRLARLTGPEVATLATIRAKPDV